MIRKDWQGNSYFKAASNVISGQDVMGARESAGKIQTIQQKHSLP